MRHRLVLVLATAVALCAVVAASAAGGGRGTLYVFAGKTVAAPGANATSLQVSVEGGNRRALRALLGQSQNQTFSLDANTEVLVWSKGIPTVSSSSAINTGDWVVVRIHAPRGSSIAEIETHAAGIVADRGTNPAGAHKPLYLFRGTVTGPQSGGKIALHVTGGDRRALRLLLGQSTDQTFSYDEGTIFLLWQGKVPSVIDASKLKAGDKITVRIRAPRGSTLEQVEATPANHVGDHEPAVSGSAS